MARLRDDAVQRPHDRHLRDLVALATDACRHLPPPAENSRQLVMCPHFRFGETVVRTVSVVARFGSAIDVTLDELRVELMYPADAAGDEFFRGAAAVGS